MAIPEKSWLVQNDSITHRLPIAVLISGRGSNLQAIIDSVTSGELPAEIRVVISNRADAAGLSRATRAGIPTQILGHDAFDDRDGFDQALADLIDSHGVELVLLAGFMRILTPTFVKHFAGRILNIHPSLLPNFQGLHTHEKALKTGADRHGASVHFVTEELDGGPVIVQASVPILPGDDADRLAERVLVQEHRIYPLAVRWYAQGLLRLSEDGVIMDGKLLTTPVLVTPENETAAP